MEKFTEALGNALLPLAQKLSENRYLKSISSGFSACLPIVIDRKSTRLNSSHS